MARKKTKSANGKPQEPYTPSKTEISRMKEAQASFWGDPEVRKLAVKHGMQKPPRGE